MASLTNQLEEMTDAFQSEPINEGEKSKKLVDKKVIGLSTASLLLGGTALTWGCSKQAISGKASNIALSDSTKVMAPANSSIGINHSVTTQLNTAFITPTNEISIAHKPIDKMSFAHAFQTARQEVGPGGIFTWHGNVYNTYYKEEWGELSLAQRKEFLKDVGYQPTITYKSTTEAAIHLVINPVYIETIVNGEKVIGIDYEGDGVIDNIVMQGKDGLTYNYLDTEGNHGLNSLYVFDPITQEAKLIENLDNPYIISSDSFEQWAEDTLAAEIMHAIFEENALQHDHYSGRINHADLDNRSTMKHENDDFDESDHDHHYEQTHHDYDRNGDVDDMK